MTLIKTETVIAEFDCRDSVQVWQWFVELVNRELSVLVLGTIKHDFPGGGLTGLVMLAESHAAIHTWPEEGRVWCELATCGDPEDCTKFRAAILRRASDG
jgi:S-adenosylmethionine/arginine decarboxylase-like enzyme